MHALAELHDVALLFPFVRPKGRAIDAFADQLAAEIGDEPRELTSDERAASALAGLLLEADAVSLEYRAYYISLRN